MSFLAEDSKSNRVRSAVLAEQPSQVWSFGVGEELPFPQGGPWAEGEELPWRLSFSSPLLPARSLRDAVIRKHI